MRDKLKAIIEKHAHLAEQMADPEIYNDQRKLTSIAKEHRSMTEIVTVGKEYISVLDQITDDKEALESGDEDLKEIARGELDELEEQQAKLEEKLKILLLPNDPNDDCDVPVEQSTNASDFSISHKNPKIFQNAILKYEANHGDFVDLLSSNGIMTEQEFDKFIQQADFKSFETSYDNAPD